ncbi:MAG: RluA family pseudouridine synthase [Saprospiraceae bacterium]|nr:RluA family pseudouridine synthase [Saprospiraceae bacterium]
MEVLETHRVPEGTPRIRLSDYAPQVFEVIPSRKGLKKAIKKGALLVNGQPGTTATWVEAGQELCLIEVDESPATVFELSLNIIHEDEHLALIQKPAGIPCSGNQFRTIVNALPFNLRYSQQQDALKRMHPVHRLDAATSGLLLIAKTRIASRVLSEAFAERQIQKTYQAVVMGRTPEHGVIDKTLDGRTAQTIYRKLDEKRSLRSDYLTLIEFEPKTGRTHQLRLHAKQISKAILGDPLYSPSELQMKGKGLFLAATALTFKHPVSGADMKFEMAAPAKFRKHMQREQERWEKYRSESS